MILPIVRYGELVLREKGRRINAITPDIHRLVADMLETMRDAKGVGLAAQQIGKALQLAVIDVTGIKDRPSLMWIQQKPVEPELYMPLIMINPEISVIKTKVLGHEGCLSFPDLGADINRPQRVHVRTQILNGQIMEFDAGGLLGRAIQHEYDHLQGRLFIDLLTPAQRKELKPEIEIIRQKTLHLIELKNQARPF